MPKSYKQGARSTHDDWLPGLRWVPRKWTMFRLPMPPLKTAGNAELARLPYQDGYPLAPAMAVGQDAEGVFFMAPHFIPKAGEWSRQAVWLGGKWRECYFCWTFDLFGHRVHVSYGLKPDFADPHWGFPEVRLAIDTVFMGGKLG